MQHELTTRCPRIGGDDGSLTGSRPQSMHGDESAGEFLVALPLG
jgi:hypothetical protein